MSGNIVHTTDATFETDVLKSQTPVLLDFWAEWCGPCKAIAPILDDIAKDYAGRVKVAKLNIDDNRQTPVKYGVRGIPTLILFKNGAPEAQQVGLVGKSKLAALLDQHLMRGYLGNQARNRQKGHRNRGGGGPRHGQEGLPVDDHMMDGRRGRHHLAGGARSVAQRDEPHGSQEQAGPRARRPWRNPWASRTWRGSASRT